MSSVTLPSLRGEPVDAVEIEFLGRVGVQSDQAVWGIGEVQVAVGFEDPVVGAVEPLAVVAIGQRRERSAGLQPGDPAVAVLAEDQPPLGVHQQAVGSRLTASGRCAGIAAGLEEDADPPALLPLEDRVAGYVGEEQESPTPIPDRPLRPVEPFRDPLDARVPGHDLVESRIEPLNRADSRRLLFLARASRPTMDARGSDPATQTARAQLATLDRCVLMLVAPSRGGVEL